MIHRIVADAYIPNPNNLPQVNHKDEDKTNNSIDNLEWCTYEYNLNYGSRTERATSKRKKPILQFTLDGDFIRRWDSATDAANQLNLNRNCISSAARGELKSSGKFK